MQQIFKKIISYIIQIEAILVLKKYKPKIVAVTGSVGKTSTKDAIYTVMAKSFYVRKSEKSFNSDIGVPLTILGCNNAWLNPVKWLQNIFMGLKLILFKNKYPEWLVLEVGADRPGDIQKITKWLKPDVAVLTKFAEVPVHIEYFKSKEEVIREKGYLAQALKHDGVLVLNSDDADVFAFKNKVPNKIITYGLFGEAEVRATNYDVYYSEKSHQPVGVHFKVEYEGNALPVNILGVLGQNNIYSSLGAIAVGLSVNLNLVELTTSLSAHNAPRGRMNLLAGIKNSTIIDDTYNSSPVAVHSALATLQIIKTAGQKIAVLGDMLELGKHTAEEHKKVGLSVAGICDVLVTVGLRARAIAESALDAGLSEKNVLQFDDSVEAGTYLQGLINENDVVLVKGSQSIRMERTVAKIMAEPNKASELLVRQEPEWQKR